MSFSKIKLLILLLITIPGCGNLSPKDNLSPQMQQKIDKIEGTQSTLENNQNALKIELARLQNALTLANSNDNKIQQGWFNLQSDGGIYVAIFGSVVIAMLLYYMYKSAHYQQATKIIAEQVKSHNDIDLKDKIMASAWNTGVEKTIYKLL